MSGRRWEGVPPDLIEIIERVCTDRQISILRLVSQRIGNRRIGLVLGIDESTVRHHRRLAAKRIKQEIAALRGVQ